MSVFSKFPPKEDLVVKTFEIDISLYEKLEYLSNQIYDASINKLVNACIEELISSREIIIYSRPKNEISITRSFSMRKNLCNSLSELRDEFNISFNRLVNIAIRNALIDEGLIKTK